MRKFKGAGPALKLIRNGHKTPFVENEFYTDAYGTWLTGYAAIIDKQGNIDGYLAMDVTTEIVQEYQKGPYVSEWLLTRRILHMKPCRPYQKYK